MIFNGTLLAHADEVRIDWLFGLVQDHLVTEDHCRYPGSCDGCFLWGAVGRVLRNETFLHPKHV